MRAEEKKEGKRFLAFDLGANSGRAMAGVVGEEIEVSELHRFPNGPVELRGTLYWDVLRLFSEMKKGLSKYDEEFQEPPLGLGIDSWGVDFGLLSPEDELLGNPVHYRDERTEGMMEEAFKKISREEIFQLTGVQFMSLNTLYQLLALKANNPSLLEGAEELLFMADLFNYFLTGEKTAEFTLTTTSQLYDPRSRKWSEELFQALDLPLEIMPEVVPPSSRIGRLSPDLAEEVGLGEVPVYAPACHDTASAVAAIPAADSENWAFLSSGTWSLLGAEITEPAINEKALDYNFTNEGGVEGTFRFLRNITGLWLLQECRREWTEGGEKLSYSELEKMAQSVEPFTSFVDSDDLLFRSPGDMPEKIRTFCRETGQRTPESKGEMVRVILESLALRYRYVLDMLQESLDKDIDILHVVGGGVQNRTLCRFTAQATGKRVLAGPVEATALGNILTQAVAAGALDSVAQGRKLVAKSFDLDTYEPDSGRGRAAWEEAYERFREIVRGREEG